MIRQVRAEDYDDIKSIKETLLLNSSRINEPEYHVKTEQAGFFLYKKQQTVEEFTKDLQKIHLVYEENDQVKGYLRIDDSQEMENDTDVDVLWYKPEMREIYFSVPHAAMAGIGLLPEFANKGIAKELLDSAIREVRKKEIPYLFSFVAVSPMTNIASLLFHERNGFGRIACCTTSEMFGLKNYQSFLFGKKL